MQRLLETTAQKLQAPELDPKGVDGLIAQPPGIRTRLLPSKLFKAVLIFQLMDYLNPAVRLGRHSCKLAVHLRTPPTHSGMMISRKRSYSKFR